MTHLIRWLLAVAGILFSLAPAQSQEPGVCISPLYHFGTRANDPIWPQEIGSIAVGPDGSLYTTSTSGGARNLGTIYKVSPSGDLTVLWEFDGLQTGAGPQGGLTDGRDGYFYGTTYTGGKFSGGKPFYKVNPPRAPMPGEVEQFQAQSRMKVLTHGLPPRSSG